MLDEETAEMFAEIDYFRDPGVRPGSYDEDGLARSSAILYIAE